MQRLICLALTVAACAQAADLAERVRARIAKFEGTVSLYAKNLDTGAAFGLREDERVRTASTIKLPVMAAVFAAVESGGVKWTDESVLRDSGKVEGSGVLREFSDGTRVRLRDLVHLMIVVSDNTATNLVLDRVPPSAVNAYVERLGLKQTRCLRKIMDTKAEAPAEWKRFGLGASTPREMVMLLEKIERGEVVSAAACKEMIEILKRQQYKDAIGRHSPHPVASKSGALDRLRSDVGIVYSPGGRIAIAITADDMPKPDWSPDNAGLVLISDLAGILVEALAKAQPL